MEKNTPHKNHLDFLKTIRMYELSLVSNFLPHIDLIAPKKNLLELGAGTGRQAKFFKDKGYNVIALDVKNSSYRNHREFEVIEYDGVNVPVEDDSQDIIFSSHVLEHVEEIEKLLIETNRILADNGICIHLIPSAHCRFWTLLSHYIWFSRRIFRKLITINSNEFHDIPNVPTTFNSWLWTILPSRHGERGNFVSEIYFYTQRYWLKQFKKANFEVIEVYKGQTFYTMANSLGNRIDLHIRKKISKIMGSACYIYILKKKENV